MDVNTVYCLRCDYDLRGLPDTGNCPECGFGIADSVKGRLLRFTDRESLSTLHSALLFLMVGTAFWTAYEIGRLLFGFTLPIIFVLTVAPIVAGLWWISIPDGRQEKAGSRLTRRLVRADAIITALYCAFLLLPSRYFDVLTLREIVVLDSTFIIFQYAGPLILTLRLKCVAEQIPSAKLARFAMQIIVVATIVLLVAATHRIAVDIYLDGPRRRPTPFVFSHGVSQALRWSLCLTNALSIMLMRSLSRRVHQQLDLADPGEEASVQREQAIP